MSDQMMSEVLARLDLLIEKLGEGAVKAWPLFVKQAFWVDGVATLVAGLVLAGTAAAAVRVVIALRNKAEDVDSINEAVGYEFGSILVAVVAVILAVVGALMSSTAVLRIINPEYYALMNIVRMLTGK